MWKDNKGFSLIEVLITIFIVLALLAGGVYVYTKFLKGFFTEGETTEKHIEHKVALEIMRLDLEHVGYGVGKHPIPANDYRIYDFDNDNKTLTIHSTLNNSDNTTIGWKICYNGDDAVVKLEAPNNNFVYVNTDGYVTEVRNDGNCPATGEYIGYPFEDDVIACQFNGANFCSEIVYYLSNANLPTKCNPNTYNLLRKVNNKTGGDPLFSCVADVKYTVDLDTNLDGKIDVYNSDTNTSVLSTADLRNQTKRISVYILYQEAFDPEGEFKEDGIDSDGAYVQRDGIKLYLPDGYKNYRWKVIKLSVKPMSIIK
jgi:type IV pilus assembly protein PilW